MKVSQCENLVNEMYCMTEQFVISPDLILKFESDFTTHLITHHGGKHQNLVCKIDIEDLKLIRRAINKILNKELEI